MATSPQSKITGVTLCRTQMRMTGLVAVTLGLAASLADQTIDPFDRLTGAMFRKAEGRHARALQADGRAINEKVCLYAGVGTALVAAPEAKPDAFNCAGSPLELLPRNLIANYRN